MTAFLRHKLGVLAAPPRAFGPKGKDHPSVGSICQACGESLETGDYTTLIPLGPGDSPEDREKARSGQWFNAVATEVHYACATGSSGKETPRS